MTSSDASNHSSNFNWTLFFKVALGHSLLLIVGFFLFQVRSCRQNKTQIVKAKLISLPVPNQPAATPQEVVDSRKNTIKKPDALPAVEPKSRSLAKRKIGKTTSRKPVKYRTPEQIRRSKLTPAKSGVSAEATSRTQPSEERIDTSNFHERLAKKLNENRASNSYELAWEHEYYQLVINELYRLWQQPTKTEVGDPFLAVKIMLKIDDSGRVTGKRVIKASGNPAMDNSVNRLLSQLSRFPPFPEKSNVNAITKTVVLKLTD